MRGLPGPYPARTMVGDVELIAIADVTLVLDPDEAAPGIELSRLCHECPAMFTADGSFHCTVTSYVIRTSDLTIVFDTGIGNRRDFGLPRGQLDLALAEIDVDPSDVDFVVNSHLHFDHVGWNTVDQGGVPRPFFSNATYLINRTEWESTMNPRLLELDDYRTLAVTVLPIEASGQLDLVGPFHQITEDVSIAVMAGHTDGHTIARIESGDEVVLVTGDASHYPAQLNHPEWSPTWDADPAAATATRAELFATLAGDGRHRIAAAHWPYPGIGRIVATPSGLVFEPT